MSSSFGVERVLVYAIGQREERSLTKHASLNYRVECAVGRSLDMQHSNLPALFSFSHYTWRHWLTLIIFVIALGFAVISLRHFLLSGFPVTRAEFSRDNLAVFVVFFWTLAPLAARSMSAQSTGTACNLAVGPTLGCARVSGPAPSPQPRKSPC
jgi:hypothetical protein